MLKKKYHEYANEDGSYKNVRRAHNSSRGKVHKVIDVGYPGRACETDHNVAETNDWFGWFVRTDEPITCGNCLRSYWPDGRKRV